VWKAPDGIIADEEFCFWAGNQRLGTYKSTNPGTVGFTTASTNLYFRGRLIQAQGTAIVTDRLGSNVTGGKRYFPYGQEKPSATTNNIEKFTGYFRDAETGLDYGDQRYHNPGTGRFTIPDPAGSGSNWYTYAGGDPINNSDSTGLSYVVNCPANHDFAMSPDDCRAFTTGTLAHPLEGPPSCVYGDPTCESFCYNNPSLCAGSTGSVGQDPQQPYSPAQPKNLPKCATNQTLEQNALNDIVSGLSKALATIPGVSNQEAFAITDTLASGEGSVSQSGQSGVSFVGGHFNLTISGGAVADMTGVDATADLAALYSMFSGGVIGRGARFSALDLGNGINLHINTVSDPMNKSLTGYSFHIDLYNPTDVVSVIQHGVVELLGGHLLPSCLDPAFKNP
jgi:RHS repeat-associated protein